MESFDSVKIQEAQPAAFLKGMLPVAPVSFFAMTLGLAETGNALLFAHDTWNIPRAYGNVFEFLAILSFLWWGALYMNKWINHRAAAVNEWRDPVQASFVALIPESLILLALAFLPYLATLSHLLFWIGSATNLTYAAFRLARMWTVPRGNEHVTPSLFLTYTASVLVHALIAGLFGYKEFGWMLFGIGVISWLILDSVVLQQLVTGGLDAKTRNFMGIYMAPAAIVLVAYQVLSGQSSDFITYALAGYSLFLTVALALSYNWLRQQAFAPGYWAYTFGVATVAQGFLLMAREQQSPIFIFITGLLLIASLLLTTIVIIGTVYLLFHKKYYPHAAHAVQAPPKS
jgi:tellurite resistance protein